MLNHKQTLLSQTLVSCSAQNSGSIKLEMNQRTQKAKDRLVPGNFCLESSVHVPLLKGKTLQNHFKCSVPYSLILKMALFVGKSVFCEFY